MKRLLRALIVAIVGTILITTTVWAVVLPTVFLRTPTSIGTTTATLSGLLNDTGGASTNCTFIYGIATNAYPWIATTTSNVSEGEVFTSNITGLTASTMYYIKAVAYNSSGNSTSSEGSFTTKGVITAPASVIWISRGPGILRVKWEVSEGASVYHLRYKPGAVADNTTLGTLAYEGPNTSYTITGLDPGTPYYVSVWGKDGSSYSTGYASGLFSTTSQDTPTTTSLGSSTPLRMFDFPTTAHLALNPTDPPYSILHEKLSEWSGMAGEPAEAVLWLAVYLLATLGIAIGVSIITRNELLFWVFLVSGVFITYQAWLAPGALLAAVLVTTAYSIFFKGGT